MKHCGVRNELIIDIDEQFNKILVKNEEKGLYVRKDVGQSNKLKVKSMRLVFYQIHSVHENSQRSVELTQEIPENTTLVDNFEDSIRIKLLVRSKICDLGDKQVDND
ncbi:hypothetical protein KIN20_001138 [Parelaphostrongylus tenuis]|uniref:Uncharacterized protein n=1 Tax=Parelaphostrongylus tenuis TaxID=148309 RepID=A0AAD5MC63_PARTN|nr:hypothetical protein KIN20_001138 [Parelaphostrongylus tenuis]